MKKDLINKSSVREKIYNFIRKSASRTKLVEFVWFVSGLDKWKQDILSPYCLEHCTDSCCNFENLGRGLSYLTESELRAVFKLDQNKDLNTSSLGKPIENRLSKEKIRGDHILVVEPGKYKLNVKICPSYNEKKCEIYYNCDRPSDCDLFPIDLNVHDGIFGLYAHQTLCLGIQSLNMSYIQELCKKINIPFFYLSTENNDKKSLEFYVN